MQHLPKTVTDQMGRAVTFPFPPRRIISLVPSQTELLYDLGLADEVVGQTLFCIHPEAMHKTKPRIGGTKNYKFDKIAALQPDLIIGNKEENEKDGIEELAKHYPVWMSDIQTLDDALEMMTMVGALTNCSNRADEITGRIRREFASFETPGTTTLRTAYLIWRNPWMAAGHNTFITSMLGRLGLQNVFEHEASRYPQISNEQLASAAPELILLSSEPYPFKEKHIAELQQLCPDAKILLVDGELFSWYGSRLLHSVDYFKILLRQING
jgi:ABC-type Fe3+-hydroxamate transport system substrate-binding protein